MVGLKKREFSTSIIVALVGGSLLFSACSTSPQQRICQEEFPLFDRRLDFALFSLRPPVRIDRGRGLAGYMAPGSVADDLAQSVADPGFGRLSDRDREEWLRWSERQLFGIQDALRAAKWIEEADRRAAVQRDLNRLANLLVMFHGQADRGSAASMYSMLERMREHQGAAQVNFCKF